MTDDRELLEKAAKGAGYEVVAWDDRMPDVPLVKGDRLGSGGVHRWYWIPLTDDGDALRLAVKLRLAVDPWGAGACVVVFCPGDRPQIREPHYGDDPERATRRAIVRAAAALADSK